MTRQVMAQQGDTVDALCHRHGLSSADVSAVYEINPGLCECGEILPLGASVTLPDKQEGAQYDKPKMLQLWD